MPDVSRRRAAALLLSGPAALWGSGLLLAGLPARAGVFSAADASQALRLALDRGSSSAVGLLGRQDGYFKNPRVYIDLPPAAAKVAGVLRMTGHQDKVDSLLLAMNRAAESAAPQALPLLKQAVKDMTIDDAKSIISGGDTSVTTFFEHKTRDPLTERFKPLVTEATRSVSLVDKYKAVLGKAGGWGLINADEFSVESYVTRKALDGLFLLIGDEERKIRQDPIATGSEILKKVFGL
jgi:hypothetical protein